MALEDVLKSDATKGVAIGVGAALLVPVVLAAASGFGRPLARAAAKGGGVFYEKTRETLAEFGEVMDDLVAEFKAEMAQREASGGTGAPETTPSPIQQEVAAAVNEAVKEAESRQQGEPREEQ